MNSIKKHSLPGYDEIAAQIENAEHVGITFSPAYCQTLLRTADEYAAEAVALPQVEAKLLEARMMLGEMMDYLHTLPYRNRAEREARTALLERAGKVLNNDANDSGATSRPQTAE